MGTVVVPSFGADPVSVTGPTLDAKVDGLATEFNGNIDNDNIKAAAGIAYSKLNLTGLVRNADVKSDAAIVDTKLATLTTAGKVNLTALVATSQAAGDTMYASSTTVWARLPKGTASQTLKMKSDASIPEWTTVAAPVFESQLLHVREEQAANTAGGTFTQDAWRTRVLNTSKTNEISGASLASNQITLPAGTYYIDASAPAHNISSHKLKLRDTTTPADLVIGQGLIDTPASGGDTQSYARLTGRFTLADQKVLELQHYCSVTGNTTGLGKPMNMGVVEVYAEVLIWKVA